MNGRKLGISFEGVEGKKNAITDVEGIEIGHSTIIEGEGELKIGKGPIRTGITAIFPAGKTSDDVFASVFSYNGNGEMTGSHWINETGHLKGPICITNTHSVGIVRDSVIEWQISKGFFKHQQFFWSLPVVAETYDGVLNDINGFHIKKKNVFEALDSAKAGQVAEGNVGGGTGMICHQFKGGIGTSSRIVNDKMGEYIVGVLVQTNYGKREDLTIAGVPVGKELKDDFLPIIKFDDRTKEISDSGSIIVIVATDAPLLPYQLKRIAKRVPAGLARVGGYGSHTSGDIFLAFSTVKKLVAEQIIDEKLHKSDFLNDRFITSIFKATVEATEEAIINALINAKTMRGINDNTVFALPHDKLREILEKYNRLDKA